MNGAGEATLALGIAAAREATPAPAGAGAVGALGWRPTAIIGGAFALVGLLVPSVEQLRATGELPAVAIAWNLGRAALWMAVYPLLLLPYRRRYARRPPRLGWGTVLSLAVLANLAALLVEVVIQAVVGLPSGAALDWLASLMLGDSPVVLYLPALLFHGAALFELGYAAEAYARQARLRAEQMCGRQREARLQALRNQLHPHFLFNALHGVSALIGREPERAAALLDRLQSLYRHSLRSLPHTYVPLVEELDWSREYLEIERERFSDRLTLTMHLPPELAAVPVPPLILQPLVENAIRHGIGRHPGPGWIAIEVSAAGGEVVIRVANSHRRPRPVSFGFGLRHTARRLREVYGAAARLEVEQGSGAIAFVLRLPREGAA